MNRRHGDRSACQAACGVIGFWSVAMPIDLPRHSGPLTSRLKESRPASHQSRLLVTPLSCASPVSCPAPSVCKLFPDQLVLAGLCCVMAGSIFTAVLLLIRSVSASTGLKLRFWRCSLSSPCWPPLSAVSQLSGTAGGWIAYLLHQWFRSRRGSAGSRRRASRGSRGLSTFWGTIIGFLQSGSSEK